eukprot:3591367-Rhodomonas_salina.1
MNLLPGSNIFVNLPDFTAREADFAPLEGGNFSARWQSMAQEFEPHICMTSRSETEQGVCDVSTSVIGVRNYRKRGYLVPVETLTVRVLDFVPAFSEREIVLDIARFQFRLPPQGVQVNQPTLLISADTPNAPVVDPRPIDESPGVFGSGRFVYFNMTFTHNATRPLAGFPNRFNLRFETIMTMAVGDKIVFTLPDFSSAKDVINLITQNPRPSPFAPTATWIRESDELEINLVGTLRATEAAVIVIDVTEGVTLPSAGILRNDPGLKIATDAAAGGVEPTSITSNNPVLAVGSFATSQLTYVSVGSFCTEEFGGLAPPGIDEATRLPQLSCQDKLLGRGRPGSNTTINFRMAAVMELFPGDVVTLNLAGFTGSDVPVISVQCVPAGLVEFASWSQATSQLRFTVANYIVAGRTVVLTVDHTVGIKLPLTALVRNDARLTIQTTASTGPIVVPQPVLDSAAVGTFTTTPTVRFFPGLSGLPTEIEFEFSPKMFIRQGETITLYLPGFQRPTSSAFATTSEPIWCGEDSAIFGCGYKFGTASWNGVRSELTFTVRQNAFVEPDE